MISLFVDRRCRINPDWLIQWNDRVWDSSSDRGINGCRNPQLSLLPFQAKRRGGRLIYSFLPFQFYWLEAGTRHSASTISMSTINWNNSDKRNVTILPFLFDFAFVAQWKSNRKWKRRGTRGEWFKWKWEVVVILSARNSTPKRATYTPNRNHFKIWSRATTLINLYSRWWCCCCQTCRCASSTDGTNEGSIRTGS